LPARRLFMGAEAAYSAAQCDNGVTTL